MCVRAYLPGYGNGGGGGRGGGKAGGGVGSEGVNGGGGRGRGGGGGGLRGSGITGVELEWQVMLDSLTGLPDLLEEDGARTTLDFTHVAGPAHSISNSRRREVIGPIAGLVAVFGVGDGAGGTAPSNSNTMGGPESNAMGFNSGGIGGSTRGSGGNGGRVLRTRRVEGLYRDRPALIRAYNVVACLTHRFSRVLLTPGGVNVSGSKIISQSHFSTVGAERDPHIAIGGRDGVRSGLLGVVSINGWEFGEDSRERQSLPGQWTTRHSLDGSGVGLMRGSVLPGIGSPREVEEIRARGLSSEQPTPSARRTEWLTVRCDATASTELWAPLWLLMRQRNLSLADKMRIVPHAFEMDAVVWKPGPFPPETDPGSGWLLTARSSALKASNDLTRYAEHITTLSS